jgi:effector-binding domain-containing protein
MKKFLSFIGIFIIGFAIWFSFFKTYDHQIKFEVNLPAGSFYHMALDSSMWGEQKFKINDKVLFKSIQMQTTINQKPFELLWQFENVNDTNAKVYLYYKNKENSFKERYQSLFNQSQNLDSLVRLSKTFKKQANIFSEMFKLEINGIENVEESAYLYVQHTSLRSEKAGDMMKSNPFLFIKNRDSLVTKTGNTFVKVDYWNPETDSISFRYAFPVKSQEEYPIDKFVQADTIQKHQALKATFYGNYSISDQAWIALYQYAKRKNIDIELTPIEIYYNNPMLGGDDKKWKAEIFMPLKKQQL